MEISTCPIFSSRICVWAVSEVIRSPALFLRPRSFVTPRLGVRLSQAEPLVPVVFGLLCGWWQRYRSSFPCSFRGPACWSIGRIPDMDIFGFLFCCAAVFGPGSGADVRTPDEKKISWWQPFVVHRNMIILSQTYWLPRLWLSHFSL